MVYKGTTWKLTQDKQCECVICGSIFLSTNKTSRYCSGACSKKAYRQRKGSNITDIKRNCKCCGKEFITHNPQKILCSKKCKDKLNAKRYRGITIDSDVSLFKLAERDNQQCQLCGLAVDWLDIENKIAGNMYPSIDHIKPISLGGLHSWDNVQLAHRYCNSWKCNKFIG